MKNYSRQREAILETLRSTNAHPTAAWIYEKTKEKIPNLSLGTVYRNLAALEQNGDILKMSVGEGTEHYDGNHAEHLHFYCESCCNIIDVVKSAEMERWIENELNCVVKGSKLVFTGICKNCREK